jgi:hypothetical protein
MWSKCDPSLDYSVHHDPSGLLQIAAYGLTKQIDGISTVRFTFIINDEVSRKTVRYARRSQAYCLVECHESSYSGDGCNQSRAESGPKLLRRRI